MKVGMYFAVFLCVVMIFLGGLVWFSDMTIIDKTIVSMVFIAAGGGLGSIGIDMLKNWD